jgi:hypothetical protein
MSFKVGESVSLLKESGFYSILRINEPFAIVQDEFGFEYQVKLASLIKRIPVSGGVVNKELSQGPMASKKQGVSSIPTLDLHAAALGIDGIPSNELLEKKLIHCRIFLNQCIEMRQAKVLIIHGVGEGVLKNAVRQLLQSKAGISFHDGNYSARGVGSTLVEIRMSEVSKF